MPQTYGLVFWGFAVVFYVTRYLCAAMICAGFASASQQLFDAAYGYVGPQLTFLAYAAFVLGAAIMGQDFLKIFWRAFNRAYIADLPEDAKRVP